LLINKIIGNNIKDKVLDFLKNCIKKENIYIMFLSFVLVFCMFSYVNEFIYNTLPKTEITITPYETEKNIEIEKTINYVTLLENETTVKFYKLKDMFYKNKNLKENLKGLEYIKKGEYNYSLNALRLNNLNNKILINLKKIPNNRIIFYNIGTSKKILIESRKEKQIIDLSKEKIGATFVYFPFSESKLFLFYTTGIYLILGFLVFYLINVIRKVFKKIKIPKYFLNYNPMQLTLIIYAIICTYVTYKFMTNTLPKSLFTNNGKLFGDQDYYWTIGKLMKDFNLLELKKTVYSFRGYFSSVLPMISLIIEKFTSINSLWLYHMLNNAFTAFLLGYLIPELHNKLALKKVKNYQIFVLFTLFFFFWKGMFYSVLADMVGITCALYSILLFIKYKENNNNKEALLSGICLGIASLSRSNFTIGFYAICFLFIFSLFCKKIKLNKTFFCYFFLGVFLICIPQIKINYDTGHIGIFAYDKKGSFLKGETLKQTHLNLMAKTSFVAWPYPVPDKTSQDMLREFSNGETISFKQGITMFSENFIITSIIIVKKIFLSLDLKTPEIYPWYKYSLHSNFYLFSFFNYFVILTGLFFVINNIFRKRLFSKKEKILGSLLYLLYMFPQTILDIEWRYYILLYLMIYYIFSFKFLEILINETFRKELKESTYLNFVSVGISFYFIFSSFYY